jgi:hypothetical protein
MSRPIWIATSIAIAGMMWLPVDANATTTLTVDGQINNITTIQNSAVVTTPSGIINVGDSYSLSATFDVSTAQLTSLYDADPRINIYYLPGTVVTLTIGSYSEVFSPPLNLNSSIQLWDGYPVGVTPEDSQSFYFFNYNIPSSQTVPFTMGDGRLDEGVSFDAFDFSATARDNDLITSLVPLSAFGSQTFSYDLLNADTGLSVVLQGSVSSANLSLSAIPEPGVWAMLIGGLFSIGYMIRRRKFRLGRDSALLTETLTWGHLS